jgi:hypothetical protein
MIFEHLSVSTRWGVRPQFGRYVWIVRKLHCKNISMLHLSTGIAARNKIHPATEWGSRSERHELEWNGEANEEIRDCNGINLRGRKRCCCRRFPDSSAAAGPTSGGGEASDRERPNRQRPYWQRSYWQRSRWQGSRRRSGSGADRHQGLTRHPNGSTRLVRSSSAEARSRVGALVAVTGAGGTLWLRPFFA